MSFLNKEKNVKSCHQYICRICLLYTEDPNSIFDPRPTNPESDIKVLDEIYFCTNLEVYSPIISLIRKIK